MVKRLWSRGSKKDSEKLDHFLLSFPTILRNSGAITIRVESDIKQTILQADKFPTFHSAPFFLPTGRMDTTIHFEIWIDFLSNKPALKHMSPTGGRPGKYPKPVLRIKNPKKHFFPLFYRLVAATLPLLYRLAPAQLPLGSRSAPARRPLIIHGFTASLPCDLPRSSGAAAQQYRGSAASEPYIPGDPKSQPPIFI